MFENLSDRLSSVFSGLSRQGLLTEQDVTAAMREIRVALLEADVALPVVKSFIRSASRKATGQAVIKSVSPGDLVVKIVHDELVSLLKGDQSEPTKMRIDNPPAAILVVGLQGSGKTTSTAKIANWLTKKQQKKVLMASLDTRRPAAMEQLKVLGEQSGIDTLPIFSGISASSIAERAVQRAEMGGYDIVLLDTAGRMHIDQELMQEVVEIRNVSHPKETLLVLDGLTGQDAVNTASEFDSQVDLSGIVLTRMEGDGRGGAALSMLAVTGKPIRFVGIGEKVEDIELFDPNRIANRILGMGDIVTFVEKATELMKNESIERATKRLQKGILTLNDMRRQFQSINEIGGIQKMLSMIPGAAGVAKNIGSQEDKKTINQQIAIINSMTKKERANPKILQASRRRRIANGAGVTVSDVNQLLKSHQMLAKMVKKLAKRDQRGVLSILSSIGIDPVSGEKISSEHEKMMATKFAINQFTDNLQSDIKFK